MKLAEIALSLPLQTLKFVKHAHEVIIFLVHHRAREAEVAFECERTFAPAASLACDHARTAIEFVKIVRSVGSVGSVGSAGSQGLALSTRFEKHVREASSGLMLDAPTLNSDVLAIGVLAVLVVLVLDAQCLLVLNLLKSVYSARTARLAAQGSRGSSELMVLLVVLMASSLLCSRFRCLENSASSVMKGRQSARWI
jgi:hypothetical protein